MACMRPADHTRFSLRVVLIATFAFMSMAHGPAMAFPKSPVAATPCHEMASSATDHGQHGSSPVIPDQGAVCYSLGCFVAVTPAPLIGKTAALRFEHLTPAPARRMFAAIPDPPDPPPRLQS
jgi:hypothetical protein